MDWIQLFLSISWVLLSFVFVFCFLFLNKNLQIYWQDWNIVLAKLWYNIWIFKTHFIPRSFPFSSFSVRREGRAYSYHSIRLLVKNCCITLPGFKLCKIAQKHNAQRLFETQHLLSPSPYRPSLPPHPFFEGFFSYLLASSKNTSCNYLEELQIICHLRSIAQSRINQA